MKKTTVVPVSEKIEKSIYNQFAALSFDKKVELFTMIRDDMRLTFELESKKQDERMCFIKDAYQNLLARQ